MRRKAVPILLLILLLLSLAAATMQPDAARPAIAIATWNMEWLVSPATAHGARLACRRGHRAILPCDVARELSRDSADLARLAWYARRLDADGHMVWHRPDLGDRVVTLERIGGPCDAPPGTAWAR